MRNRKIRILFLPVVSLLIILSLTLAQNLKKERALPDPEWSRAISIPAKSSEPYLSLGYSSKNRHEIFYSSPDHHVEKIAFNSSLKVISQKKLNALIPEKSTFWSDGRSVVYQKEQQIIINKNGKEKILAANIDGFNTAKDMMIFWKGKQLFKIGKDNYKIISVGSTDHRIDKVIVNGESSSILIKNSGDSLEFFKKEKTRYTHHLLNVNMFTPNSMEYYSDFIFVENNKTLVVAYRIFSMKSGGKFSRFFTSELPLSNLGKKVEFKKETIIDQTDGGSFLGIDSPNLSYINNRLALTFTAIGNKTAKKEKNMIYGAYREKGNWIAKRRSMNDNLPLAPLQLSSHTMVWLDILKNGNGVTYQLKGSTTDPKVKSLSQRLTKEDWKNALSSTSMTVVFFFLLSITALIWIVPTMLFLFIMYMLNTNRFERAPAWITNTGIILYVITQFIFIQKFFNASFYLFAPKYLTFSGSNYLIPAFLAVMAAFFLKWAKDKNWGIIEKVSYFTVVNTVLCIFLIAPYVI